MMDSFWRNRRVFLTGHTGFKGAWLSLWLHERGAEVTGYALEPPTNPSLFDLARVDQVTRSIIGDIRDADTLAKELVAAKPDVVFHMAAQPLVRDSYRNPVETYSTNVMGTVNLLEAVRLTRHPMAVVNVTTDKCYHNMEWGWGYRENEALGGLDPYSSSKACSELVTTAYRHSFFNPAKYADHGVALASARAGNVVGGGDWAPDRLIPDCVRALLRNKPVVLRFPQAVRPWQHVLEPLSGYLLLARHLIEQGDSFAEAWNFGPPADDAITVEAVVAEMCRQWGDGARYETEGGNHPHEAHCLKLDSSKARSRLGWQPRWDIKETTARIVEWTRAYRDQQDMLEMCLRQIREYEGGEQGRKG